MFDHISNASKFITCKTFWIRQFQTFYLSHIQFLATSYLISDKFWLTILDTYLKHSESKFTSWKHKLAWNSIKVHLTPKYFFRLHKSSQPFKTFTTYSTKLWSSSKALSLLYAGFYGASFKPWGCSQAIIF